MAKEGMKGAALGIELRQIIKTDHRASEMIRQAEKQAEDIAQETGREVAQIYEQGRQRREELQNQVDADVQDIIEEKKNAAAARYEHQHQMLAQKLTENGDKWTEQMLSNILHKDQ